MKAMVFAAGLGTRLRPETENKPKALVEVGGKPMLQHVIEHLKDAGVNSLVVNVHHFAEQIVEFLKANNNFGMEIHISNESDLLLDTGGGVVKAHEMLTDNSSVILHNADILTDVDLRRLYEAHSKAANDVTLLVDANRNSSRQLLFGTDGRMHGWLNCKTGQTRPGKLDTEKMTKLSFNGIHVMSQHALQQLVAYSTGTKPFSITDFYIEACKELNIASYLMPSECQWFDIGSHEKLQNARMTYRQ